MKKKLKEQLDGRSMTWFVDNYIRPKCFISYFTFMNQLDGRATMRGDVKTVIQKFIYEKKAEEKVS